MKSRNARDSPAPSFFCYIDSAVQSTGAPSHSTLAATSRRAAFVTAVASAVALIGCVEYSQLDVGYAASTSGRSGHSGSSFSLRDGSLGRARRRVLASSFAARLKLGDQLQQYAFGPDFTLFPYLRGELAVFARGGLHLLQFEDYEGDFAFGAYSPYLEGGASYPVYETEEGNKFFVSAGLGAEYDLRFTSQPSSGYVTAFIGVGFSRASTGEDPFAPPPVVVVPIPAPIPEAAPPPPPPPPPPLPEIGPAAPAAPGAFDPVVVDDASADVDADTDADTDAEVDDNGVD